VKRSIILNEPFESGLWLLMDPMGFKTAEKARKKEKLQEQNAEGIKVK
jgi:hypothetical protein